MSSSAPFPLQLPSGMQAPPRRLAGMKRRAIEDEMAQPLGAAGQPPQQAGGGSHLPFAAERQQDQPPPPSKRQRMTAHPPPPGCGDRMDTFQQSPQPPRQAFFQHSQQQQQQLHQQHQRAGAAANGYSQPLTGRRRPRSSLDEISDEGFGAPAGWPGHAEEKGGAAAGDPSLPQQPAGKRQRCALGNPNGSFAWDASSVISGDNRNPNPVNGDATPAFPSHSGSRSEAGGRRSACSLQVELDDDQAGWVQRVSPAPSSGGSGSASGHPSRGFQLIPFSQRPAFGQQQQTKAHQHHARCPGRLADDPVVYGFPLQSRHHHPQLSIVPSTGSAISDPVASTCGSCGSRLLEREPLAASSAASGGFGGRLQVVEGIRAGARITPAVCSSGLQLQRQLRRLRDQALNNGGGPYNNLLTYAPRANGNGAGSERMMLDDDAEDAEDSDCGRGAADEGMQEDDGDADLFSGAGGPGQNRHGFPGSSLQPAWAAPAPAAGSGGVAPVITAAPNVNTAAAAAAGGGGLHPLDPTADTRLFARAGANGCTRSPRPLHNRSNARFF